MSAEPEVSPMEQQVRERIEQLRGEGWQVVREPSPQEIPPALRDLRLDYIARRGAEVVIGEVAHRFTSRQERIDAIAKRVADLPNARLEVYWIGDTPVVKPDPSEVQRYITEAEAVSGVSLQAALLMALAAFEGAVATFADEAGIKLRVPARQLLANLYSLGFVEEADYNRLNALYTLRTAIAHLATPTRPDPGDIQFCLNLARQMLEGRYVSADQMIEWFKEQYEAPEHHTPFESREGGYLYASDEPVTADDVLRDEFSDAPEPVLRDAIERLEDESYEWVHRWRDEDMPEDEQ